jgi:hypothetical protein
MNITTNVDGGSDIDYIWLLCKDLSKWIVKLLGLVAKNFDFLLIEELAL